MSGCIFRCSCFWFYLACQVHQTLSALCQFRVVSSGPSLLSSVIRDVAAGATSKQRENNLASLVLLLLQVSFGGGGGGSVNMLEIASACVRAKFPTIRRGRRRGGGRRLEGRASAPSRRL